MIVTTNHGPVRELQLNRPPANALSPELIVALKAAIETAPNEGVRALVLSGTPGMFSGGLDVPRWLALDRPALAQAWRDFYSLMRALACSPIPIAAAINGHGPGGRHGARALLRLAGHGGGQLEDGIQRSAGGNSATARHPVGTEASGWGLGKLSALVLVDL